MTSTHLSVYVLLDGCGPEFDFVGRSPRDPHNNGMTEDCRRGKRDAETTKVPSTW